MNRKEELAKKRGTPVLCKLCNKMITRGNIPSHENSIKHTLLSNIKKSYMTIII